MSRSDYEVRILSLNESRFEDSGLWRQHSVAITDLDPLWHRRLFFVRMIKLFLVSREFDVVLFHLDMRLAALCGLIRGFLPSKPTLIFQGFFCDISRSSVASASLTGILRNKVSRVLNRIVVHTMNVLVVHTSAEVDLYSTFFRVPKSRFAFVPYFHYGNDPDAISATSLSAESSNVLAIGRHRDFNCFIRAVTGSGWQSVIVAGDSDRKELDAQLPSNIAVHYEVSREEYRDHISRSTVVVLPFHTVRWQRALGHIAMFEAMLRQKPIVAAQTFQVTDYASTDEILYYRPGDAEDLRRQLDRLMTDPYLRKRLTQNARTRLLGEFTREKYIAKLIDVCLKSRSSASLKGMKQTFAS